MQVAEQNTVFKTIGKLSSISPDIPIKSQQAWLFSLDFMAKYLVEHADNGSGLSSDNAALLAAARMGWLLEQTRPSLSGLFSEGDAVALMDCYQGDMFFPDQFDRIASDLCDHLGVELDGYATSSIGPLVDKLQGLSAVQRVALADALEQAWHRGMKQENKSPTEFFATLGINLA